MKIKSIRKNTLSNIMSFIPKKRLQQKQMSVVEKPILAYMYDEKQRELYNGLFSSLFGNNLDTIKNLYEATKQVTQKKQEQKQEFKEKVKIEVKAEVKQKVEQKVEQRKKSRTVIFDDYYYYHPYYKYPLREKTLTEKIQKFFSDFFKGVGNIVFFVPNRIQEYKAEKQEKIRQRNEAENKKRYEIARRLKYYQTLFGVNDFKPDFSEFQDCDNLSLEELEALDLKLVLYLKNQQEVVRLKNNYKTGANSYATGNERQILRFTRIENIEPKYNVRGSSNGRKLLSYRKELIRICEIFFSNSKTIQEPIKVFQRISNRFFIQARKNLDEIKEWQGRINIFDLSSLSYETYKIISKSKNFEDFMTLDKDKKKILHSSEMIPIAGLVPKTVRVCDQYNLTDSILQDYKDVNKQYVENGTKPLIDNYNKQFKEIEKFVDEYKTKINKEDTIFTKTMMKKVNNVKNKHIKTYNKIFNTFVEGGCNLKKICNKIRIKGFLSLGIKALTSLVGV